MVCSASDTVPLKKALGKFPGQNWISHLFPQIISNLKHVKFGIRISPKGQQKHQDRFADGFANNGRRTNLKLHKSMSFVDVFLEISTCLSYCVKMDLITF